MIKDIQDIYSINFEKLSEEKGFGDKKIKGIIDAIEKSKEQPFSRVLISLGISEVGKKIVDMLIKNGVTSMDKLFEIVDENNHDFLCNIPLIAEKTSSNIIEALKDPIMRRRIEGLRLAGLKMEVDSSQNKPLDNSFENQVWAVTGSFINFNPRAKALEEVEKRGGRTVSSISSKTTHLLLGKGGGSKKTKAEKLNIIIVEEDEFMSLISKDEPKNDKIEFEQGELF